MKTHAHDPVHGCTHGAAVDPETRGLTKKEWLVGCAMQGCAGTETDPEKAVDWAIKCAELAIKKLNHIPKEDVVP